MVTTPHQTHDNQQKCHNDIVRGKANQKTGSGRSGHSNGKQDPGAEAVSSHAPRKLADAIGNTIGRDQSTCPGVREKEITADKGEKRGKQRHHQMMAKVSQCE